MWILKGRDKNLLTLDDVKNNPKKCLEKQKAKPGMTISLDPSNPGISGSGETITVNACMCDDKDLCNVAATTKFTGIALILIQFVPLLNHWIFSRFF